MSETPRTDANIFHPEGNYGFCVEACFARQLERELADARREYEIEHAEHMKTVDVAQAALKAKEEAEQKTSIWEAECEVMRHAHALATKRAEEAARDAERYRVVRNGDVVGFAVMAISEAYERHLSIDGDRLDALADEARKP
jgi:cell division septum initiation protein DivIVA